MSNFKLPPVLVFCILLGGAVFVADFVVAVDEVDSIYGQGVHAFFDRDYEEAVHILSKAERIKHNDPRPYYFLGLAYLRQRKTEQADQCFKKAAQLEFSERTLRDYAVSESLRRIQGAERQRIEKIRIDERMNAQAREQVLQEMRYGKENAAAGEQLPALQQMENSFGNNPFGVKPMDPLNTSGESVVLTRTESNPFGGIMSGTGSIPEQVSAPTVQRTGEPAVVRTERTFVNPNIPAAQQDTARQTAAAGASMSDTARQLGKTLGSMFSKKASAEEQK